MRLSDNETFANKLVTSPTLNRQIDTSVQNHFMNLADALEFRNAVEQITSDASRDLAQDVKANKSAIASFDTRLLKLSSGSGLKPGPGDGGQYNMEEIAKLVSAQEATESRLRSEIERLSEDVANLRMQLAESQTTLQGIENSQKITAEFGRSRSYLLRENANTALSDLNLSVTLGRKSNGSVEKIVFSGSRGPIEWATKASARIGESFVIVDREGRRFEATLTYNQGRFLAKDYVRLEMTPLRSSKD